ncbi:error-prone DNA polymerase [Reyranella sp. CPCC 100927]|uniref:error-prone DNA polymerase n=1 Tax=Reyranella sp. CPCC 100927 TaxID=2599616 RepID=UPI0011B7CF4B|nr:error-prone DNA polymerase [Reyranella sp. CPCC 100927]TWT05961.1 error-prone DNA polymerase [Reyranella sp. CPCC 100927]
MTGFAELAATTNFSFRRGASHPQEIVMCAKALGLKAIGIADRNTMAGVVRAHAQARKENIKLLVGTRLVTVEGFEAVCYPTDRAAYGRLCRLLTTGNRRAPKGECHLSFEEVCDTQEGQIFIVMPPRELSPDFTERLATLAAAAPDCVYLGASFLYRGDERRRLGMLAALAADCGTPLAATNDVLYHAADRRALADVLTCIREKCTIVEAGFRVEANAERHLKNGFEMARLFAQYPDAVARTLDIADRIDFTLDSLRYEYPEEPVPAGKTPQQYLEELTWEKAAERYPEGVPAKVRALLFKELALIRHLDYARYFLTVYDVVKYARSQEILCQGRGSAANSAVCYCLGITSVNPNETQVLFERFLSAERREPPDIDVDFEHERREEVIQYLYTRYGRERAAICSTVIHYRPRMAIRDVGKAMGLKDDVTAALSNTMWGSGEDIPDSHIREVGLDPANPQLRLAIGIARTLLDFPRHLSQHVGGFVLTRERLDESVPILNAAMDDRTIIEWDKDDIDELGMMKVDVLALGMLTCIRKSFDLVERHYGKTLTLAMPPDDPDVYAMMSKADTIGVFQIESRAQMSMLPRLKPKEFYDLVIEIAIVRPGPIQGDMVHPYLRRRDKLEPVEFPSKELEGVLGRTLGVPLFQEQAMEIAIVAAGFTADEANGLRKAMATFRHNGTIYTFRDKFIDGMVRNGYEHEFAARCFSQIEGFGEYGFPESHAASFALLAYVSSWLKHYHPDVFCAALLNSQPMGFYQPAQLVRDARDHGVEVRHPDINFSDWDCTLEPADEPLPTGERPALRAAEGSARDSVPGEGASKPQAMHLERTTAPSPGANAPTSPRQGEVKRCALRLGFSLVDGMSDKQAEAIMANRGQGYDSLRAFWIRSGVSIATLQRLAEADAFRSLGLDRRQALWAVKGLDGGTLQNQAAKATSSTRPLLTWSRTGDLFDEAPVALPTMTPGEHVVEDYGTIGLSLKAHPCSFFRPELERMGVITSRQHWDERLKEQRVSVAGLVLVRQRPGTAKGVIFLTLEDETGIVNAVVWPDVFEANRRIVMNAQLLLVRGKIQREGIVIHVVAERFVDLSDRLALLRVGDMPAALPIDPSSTRLLRSRDFH